MTRPLRHPVNYEVFRCLPHAEGVRLQKERLAEMAGRRESPGVVLFCEHTPVITCGRSGDGSSLLATPEELAREGVEYCRAGRGGDVTYHGPGQWTVYPLLRLDWYGRDLHRYLRLLEECVIRFLAGYGVSGGRREGLTGAWVGREKVSAVGVAVSRWITWHGFALNISPDLSRFSKYMHPCGITADRGGVTSLEALTGVRRDMEDVLPALREAMAEVLGVAFLPLYS